MQVNKTSRRDYYILFNHGTTYAFDPDKKRINEFTNKESTLLEIQLDYVNLRNDKAVFILDNHGIKIYRMPTDNRNKRYKN